MIELCEKCGIDMSKHLISFKKGNVIINCPESSPEADRSNDLLGECEHPHASVQPLRQISESEATTRALGAESEPRLLPCPFCGGEAAFNTARTSCKDTIRLNGQDTFHGVNCIKCGVHNNGLGLGYKTQERAHAHWNIRAWPH